MTQIFLPLQLDDRPPSPIGEQAADLLAPWLNPDLAILLRAIGVMLDPIAEIVTEQGVDGDPDYVPGYGIWFDVDLCPLEALPYLAQYVGVSIPVGADEATARALVKEEAGQSRGTLPSVVSAVRRNLTGAQSVVLLERTGPDGITPNAYWFVIIVRPEEVIDLDALKSAVDAVKPGGVLYTVVETDSYTWNEAERTWGEEAMTWNQTASQRP